MKDNNNHPYYNRPYKLIIAATIAVLIVVLMGWSILKMIEKVSEDKNDFDYTFIHLKYDNDREMLIKREFQLDGLYLRANVYFYEQACITSP